jgi:hypothetical protein
VRKYDGVEHRRWPAHIARIEGFRCSYSMQFSTKRSNTICWARFRRERSAPSITGWIAGTTSFVSATQSGAVEELLLQRKSAAEFDGRVLSYVDLDIDVLVAPDLTYKILDVEDFEANAMRYSLSG